ncbi:MAG: response regulator transcription factor [Ignavibacteria bacterium]|nr:response regulator transcription factor [Ignavibacteria bacterium]MBI3766755.1 response regulator transcription factor [Ignavibacteriales bacterium]
MNTSTKTILVVDDERDIVDLVKYNLVKEGYVVLTARTGKQALEQAQHHPQLILLDIMMPEYDGLEVLKRLKQNERTSHIPVIFLTAKGSDVDEVLGLELGANDYIVKPISIPKLLARVKSTLRKHVESSRTPALPLTIGAIEILPSQHIVRVHGKETFFPKKEFDVLLYLAKHSDQVVNRESLLNAVWGSDVLVVDRTVDVHVRKIREKLGRYAGYIETIKGVGYRLREPA